MKKFYVIAMMALATLTASAQSLTISTYAGTDVTKHNGQTKNVNINRYLFKGWNTICLPFSMTAEEVTETFGTDCKLETLVGVENDGANIKLNFQDCKSTGLEANHPYILYYNKESKSVKFTAEKTIKSGKASISFNDENGVEVTFSGTSQKKNAEGLYGILAKDNAEAEFVNVDNTTSGFYATRCYVQLSTGNNTILKTNHIAAGDITAIKNVVKAGERVDVYNISGVKVASNATISDVNKLNKGVYVVKGKKIAVK